MGRNESQHTEPHSRLAFAALAAALVILITMSVAPAAPRPSSKDNPEDFTRIYGHTYDEVFQGAQETIERMGLFVTTTDKDKGIITGNGKYFPKGATAPTTVDFQIRIESVSSKPETRVTISCTPKEPLNKD